MCDNPYLWASKILKRKIEEYKSLCSEGMNNTKKGAKLIQTMRRIDQYLKKKDREIAVKSDGQRGNYKFNTKRI
jgi:hypothetical protein